MDSTKRENKGRKRQASNNSSGCSNDNDKNKRAQIRYDPDVPMNKEQLAAWRREARRVRNRESAAASRQRTRNRIAELESEVAQWKGKYEAAMKQLKEMETKQVQQQCERDLNSSSRSLDSVSDSRVINNNVSSQSSTNASGINNPLQKDRKMAVRTEDNASESGPSTSIYDTSATPATVASCGAENVAVDPSALNSVETGFMKVQDKLPATRKELAEPADHHGKGQLAAAAAALAEAARTFHAYL